HGAIGVTEEFDLQLLTRRLHEWRTTHGSEACWAAVIGDASLADQIAIVDFARGVAGNTC
ncbi:MAG TPA: acyl-CoA dehydrogenase, partial [Cupriavidus sp.]|nr:acyl-CoA dehydrogenase [Cupriavidus sp.]